MDEARRKADLDWLFNPKTPDPFVSLDYGVLMRDVPPRRTLRERVRSLVWWGRPESSDRAEAHE
ncbi:MAG TPA: hypothetical protein VGO48_14845 [Conexibacter sp.]|jgi:hypothetical protein|nr:hypothetical protein [Conexibacter sp.]